MATTPQQQEKALESILTRIRACRYCDAQLPLGARPVIRASITARILVVGQAPGVKVHETGIPWNDPSGDRLRHWMGLDRDAFYDVSRIAIMPMGLCYPGRHPKGGDLPPRPECAPRWFLPVLALMPQVELTLLARAHAQRWYLGERMGNTLTETVTDWHIYAPRYLPMPHPFFRNNRWLRTHPWFETQLDPWLRTRVCELMNPRS